MTRASRVACAVLTADCLPVLLCDRAGSVVAAAHAGWRGLAAGVLESCVRAMAANPGDIMAWLGPAIGRDAFEVGPEVRHAFLEAGDARETADCFQVSSSREGHFLADLYALARLRLAAAGVVDVFGGEHCTYSDANRFYSYRRDGQTGRMASLILINS
jgi:YfiH family protein